MPARQKAQYRDNGPVPEVDEPASEANALNEDSLGVFASIVTMDNTLRADAPSDNWQGWDPQYDLNSVMPIIESELPEPRRNTMLSLEEGVGALTIDSEVSCCLFPSACLYVCTHYVENRTMNIAGTSKAPRRVLRVSSISKRD